MGRRTEGRADPRPQVASAARWTARHSWAAVAIGLTLAGLLGSVLAGMSQGRADSDKAGKALERTSANIASTLQLAIEHEDDLIVNVAGYYLQALGDPQEAFSRWGDSVRVFARYPELQRVAIVVVVSNAALPAYLAEHRGAGPPLTVVPAGTRASYCLPGLELVRSTLAPTYTRSDNCAGNTSLLTGRDSGLDSYSPVSFAGADLLGSQAPVYSTAVIPTTVAARRAHFLGWVGMLSDPALLLSRARRGYPGVLVSMHYHAAGSPDVTFTSGNTPAGATASAVDLHNGWTVTTSGAVAGGGLFTATGAVELLAAGVVLSVLLGLFVFILATGRERARRLVEARTGELRHQALHDALTGLPNRALVTDRITQMLARNRRNPTGGGALFMDLDDFKDVNDTLGHQAGDRLLVSVAARLVSALREVDTIARLGGDEFVVVVDSSGGNGGPELLAQRLLEVMRQPFEIEGVPLPLTVNISIGIATGDRASAGELLRDADVALYHAKRRGKNRYDTFNSAMYTTMVRRTELEFDLRSALADGQYRLVYQPFYNLDDLTVIGVEALLRWDHPTLGLLYPEEFIPLLERSGEIRPVGRWVLQQACAQMATWHSRGDSLDVSVNISARQLEGDDILTDIADALRESGLPATRLIIEVIETALMADAEATARRLSLVKELGVRIAVDGFGTGYSSLAYLRQFPLDSLKIDRSFTHAVTTSPESEALIRTLVQLGKDLGLQTLAEGIETTTEMDVLRGAHVEQAQGFLMARPLDPETLEVQFLAPTRPVTPAKLPAGPD